jgi:hypothetical protein
MAEIGSRTMRNVSGRFTLNEAKFQKIVALIQQIHAEATEEDVKAILLDDVEEDTFQDWLDTEEPEALADWVRQYLEKTF